MHDTETENPIYESEGTDTEKPKVSKAVKVAAFVGSVLVLAGGGILAINAVTGGFSEDTAAHRDVSKETMNSDEKDSLPDPSAPVAAPTIEPGDTEANAEGDPSENRGGENNTPRDIPPALPVDEQERRDSILDYAPQADGSISGQAKASGGIGSPLSTGNIEATLSNVRTDSGYLLADVRVKNVSGKEQGVTALNFFAEVGGNSLPAKMAERTNFKTVTLKPGAEHRGVVSFGKVEASMFEFIDTSGNVVAWK